MLLAMSFNTTGEEFRLQMNHHCPKSYSDLALKLIYEDIVSREKEGDLVVYTPMQVELEYEEYSYTEFAEQFDIALDETASEDDFKRVVTEAFGQALLGFTAGKTVVIVT